MTLEPVYEFYFGCRDRYLAQISLSKTCYVARVLDELESAEKMRVYCFTHQEAWNLINMCMNRLMVEEFENAINS